MASWEEWGPSPSILRGGQASGAMTQHDLQVCLGVWASAGSMVSLSVSVPSF